MQSVDPDQSAPPAMSRGARASVASAVATDDASAAWAASPYECPEILDATSCIVMVVAIGTGVVVGMNRAAETVTGYPRRELIGHPFWDSLLIPAEHARTSETYAVPDGRGIPLAHEGVVLTSAGESRRIFWSNDFLLEDGVRAYVVRTGIDVTAQHATAGLFSHLMRTATSTAFIATDLDGIITSFSLGAEQMLGYTAAEMMGIPLPLGIFEASQLRSRGTTSRAGALTGLLGDGENPENSEDWVVVRKDGTQLIASIAVSTVTDSMGAPVGYLGVGSDVTGQRQTTDLLVDALAKERRAVDLLRHLDDVKTDFIQTVSHEVRTPLTTISGGTEMLLDGLAGPLNPRQTKLVDSVSRNAERLANLAADLDILSSAEEGKLPRQDLDVDLGDLVIRSEGGVKGLIIRRQLAMSFRAPTAPVVVNGDRRYLGRVIFNLLSNAIKFTADGGSVSCALTVVESGAVLHVHDTGIGIPEDEQVAIFESFYRSTNARELVSQGAGLGLASAAWIVHDHGGTIDCFSEPEHGTTFTVRLPLAAGSQARPVAQSEGRQALPGPLLAD